MIVLQIWVMELISIDGQKFLIICVVFLVFCSENFVHFKSDLIGIVFEGSCRIFFFPLIIFKFFKLTRKQRLP